ncbi:unnamed protein product [Ectocarpus sp. 12 AP-2014]
MFAPPRRLESQKQGSAHPRGITERAHGRRGTATAATGDMSTLTSEAVSSASTPEPRREKTRSAPTNMLAGQLSQGNMLRPPTIPGRRVNEHPSGSGGQEAGGGGSSATDAGSSKAKGKGAPKGGSAKGKGSSGGGKAKGKGKGKGKAKESTSSGSATKPPSPSCHAKGGTTTAAWEAAHGGRDEWYWEPEEKYELLRAFASSEQRGLQLGPEVSWTRKGSYSLSFDLWIKFILLDVVARLKKNDKYRLPNELAERKFMHKGNFCHIKIGSSTKRENMGKSWRRGTPLTRSPVLRRMTGRRKTLPRCKRLGKTHPGRMHPPRWASTTTNQAIHPRAIPVWRTVRRVAGARGNSSRLRGRTGQPCGAGATGQSSLGVTSGVKGRAETSPGVGTTSRASSSKDREWTRANASIDAVKTRSACLCYVWEPFSQCRRHFLAATTKTATRTAAKTAAKTAV